jgi:hypothetical protein
MSNVPQSVSFPAEETSSQCHSEAPGEEYLENARCFAFARHDIDAL